MPRSTFLLAASTLPFLGACGLITETEYLTIGDDPAEALVSEVAASTVYDPATHGSMTFQEGVATGIPGFIGNPDGSVSEVLVRVEDGVLYVSRDGGAEEAYETMTYGSDRTTSMYGEWSNGTDQFYVSMNDGSPGWLDDRASGSRGYGGMETDLANLPSGSVIYTGYLDSYNEDSYIYGNLGLNVDFASGSIGGAAVGNYGIGGEGSDVAGAFLGEIAGTVSGGRIGGTIFAEGEEMTGEFDFQGGVYGETADYIAGGFGGTITTGAGDTSVGGGFYTSSGSDYRD